MEYRQLGRTDIKVSALCLGTMTWGQQNTQAQGHDQMDFAVAQGINFFDTAELYSVPPKSETYGRTEEIIGSWLAQHKNRDKIILATKVIGCSNNTWFRDNGEEAKLDAANIKEAVDKSLRRLKTDYIDLYQVHWPDRPLQLFKGLSYVHMEGVFCSINETLSALADLVAAGKIRHIGISNETPWGTMNYLKENEVNGLPRIQSIQNSYNLLNRSFETGLSEIAHREDVGLLAYSPLGQGYLTGKYQNDSLPQGSRKALFNRLQRYETANAAPAIDRYVKLAKDHNIDPGKMALQFVTSRPFVTSTIFGATTMAQLKSNIDSQNIVLTAELQQAIEDIHLVYSNPCP
jgi:aryl-alcohol dehydrogenase-like predicted oxidoreductase